MIGFWNVFTDEIKNLINAPFRLLMYVGLPMFLFFLYASIFGDGALRDIPVVLQDQDKSALSRELVRQLNANSTIEFVSDVNNEQEAMHQIRTGKAFAWISIPENFERDIQRGQGVNVILNYNGDYITPGGLLYKAFNQTLSTFSASAKVNVLMKKGQSIQQAKLAANPVTLDQHTLFNPSLNYTYYLCLSLFPMALQMCVMVVTIFILGSILKYNKGKEIYKRGGNAWNVYWGKVLPYTLLYFLVATVMITYLFGYQQIPINCPISYVYIITLLFIIVTQLMALFFASIASDFRTLSTIGGGYAALAFSFSGYTFPSIGMPLGIQIMDMVFPFSSYARMFTDLSVKGMPLFTNVNYLIGFSIFALIGIFSLPKFGVKLQKGHYEKD